MNMMRWVTALLLLMSSPALASEDALAPPPLPVKTTKSASSYCPHLKRQADRHNIPGHFFVRLIWKESRFNPGVVSPKGAQGIAQFMPGTAGERGLEDPFDPIAAISESAKFLRELIDEFGNPGLAAAAYNAGPQRVRNWIAGRSGLPWETREFVRFITGLTAMDWRLPNAGLPEELKPNSEMIETSCIELASRAHPVQPYVAGAPWRPWGVQLTADFSRTRAMVRFSHLKTRYASILAAHEPMVVRKRNLSFGRRPRYAIRIGADDRISAEKLCARLRSKGGACIVAKN
jgi:hypothetical protein